MGQQDGMNPMQTNRLLDWMWSLVGPEWTANEKLLLAYIITERDDKGSLELSYNQAKEKSAIRTTNAVKNAMNRLIDKGLVTREQNGGGQSASVYKLNTDRIVEPNRVGGGTFLPPLKTTPPENIPPKTTPLSGTNSTNMSRNDREYDLNDNASPTTPVFKETKEPKRTKGTKDTKEQDVFAIWESDNPVIQTLNEIVRSLINKNPQHTSGLLKHLISERDEKLLLEWMKKNEMPETVAIEVAESMVSKIDLHVMKTGELKFSYINKRNSKQTYINLSYVFRKWARFQSSRTAQKQTIPSSTDWTQIAKERGD